MKITNLHNLPEAVYNKVARIREPIKDRFHVTDLCNAPLMRYLREKHWDSLKEDASDRIWALLGSAVHYILEETAPSDSFAEETLEAQIGNATIVGTPDLWHRGIISDYKTTSVFSFLLGDKPEWSLQLNLYAWLYRKNGFVTDKLQIHAILRDWMKSKSLQQPDYPSIPFCTVTIPLIAIEQHIVNWLENYYRNPMEECTPGQKWSRPTTYAVMEKGKVRAKRVLETSEDAEIWLKENGSDKMYIETRKGANIRCENYCQVSEYCSYAKGEK